MNFSRLYLGTLILFFFTVVVIDVMLFLRMPVHGRFFNFTSMSILSKIGRPMAPSFAVGKNKLVILKSFCGIERRAKRKVGRGTRLRVVCTSY